MATRLSSGRRSASSRARRFLDGEYGYRDSSMGVPVILGGGGVERVVEIPLTADEKVMLDKSGESVKSIVEVCRRA